MNITNDDDLAFFTDALKRLDAIHGRAPKRRYAF